MSNFNYRFKQYLSALVGLFGLSLLLPYAWLLVGALVVVMVLDTLGNL